MSQTMATPPLCEESMCPARVLTVSKTRSEETCENELIYKQTIRTLRCNRDECDNKEFEIVASKRPN